jgi:hypothetical protein
MIPAMWSDLAVTLSAIRAGVAAPRVFDPAICSSRYEATARGVEWSKTIVGESLNPVYAESREANSVAASESIPASINGVSDRIVVDELVSSCTMRSTAVTV